MSRGRRTVESSTAGATCYLCGRSLNFGRLIRRSGRWLHRDCWQDEKGE